MGLATRLVFAKKGMMGYVDPRQNVAVVLSLTPSGCLRMASFTLTMPTKQFTRRMQRGHHDRL